MSKQTYRLEPLLGKYWGVVDANTGALLQRCASYQDAMKVADRLTKESPMIGENAQAAADFAQHPDDCDCEACENTRDPWTVCAQCGSEVRASELHVIGCDICECGMLVEECACADEPAPHKSFEECCDDPTFLAAVNSVLRTQGAPTIKRALAGAALIATCLLPTYARAQERAYPIIGTPAYNASCQIVTEWEDGSARAYCEEDGETYLFDADGFFYDDHGIRFYGRPPGTWYVAPERLQIGPNAPAGAR